MPTAMAPVGGRVRSRVRIAIVNPSPSSPSRFSTGTRQSLKWSATGGEPRQVASLLRLGAGEQDRQPAEGLDDVLGGGGGAGRGDLFGHERQRQASHVGATVGLRHPDPEEPLLSEEPQLLGGERLGLVERGRQRRDLLAREL